MDFQAFLKTLPLMGYGMLGIFAVMVVIYIVIFALNRFTGKQEDK